MTKCRYSTAASGRTDGWRIIGSGGVRKLNLRRVLRSSVKEIDGTNGKGDLTLPASALHATGTRGSGCPCESRLMAAAGEQATHPSAGSAVETNRRRPAVLAIGRHRRLQLSTAVLAARIPSSCGNDDDDAGMRRGGGMNTSRRMSNISTHGRSQNDNPICARGAGRRAVIFHYAEHSTAQHSTHSAPARPGPPILRSLPHPPNASPPCSQKFLRSLAAKRTSIIVSLPSRLTCGCDEQRKEARTDSSVIITPPPSCSSLSPSLHPPLNSARPHAPPLFTHE